MTVAVDSANPAQPIAPPAQLTTRDEECEHQDSSFAVLLATLARPPVTATAHDRLDLRPIIPSACEVAVPWREALYERRAAEFQETSVFGLVEVIALANDSVDGIAVSQQVSPSWGTRASRPLQRTHAPDIDVFQAVLGGVANSETSAQGVSPRPPLGVSPPVHTSLRPQDVVSDAAPATIRVQGRAENRSPERPSLHRADQRAPSLASGQRNAVHVAITAAEHGLSIFARVGRMEPTERARLRHAAALLLAEHGHHGATVMLDADLAEAKGE